MKRNKVAVVLVNYKDYAKRYLKDCYQSLQNQSYMDFDVFIADNSSDTETVKTIAKLAPKAIVIKNKENLGWAGGNNSVIKTKIDNYEYFILLNMDTVLDKDWLKELLEYSQAKGLPLVQSKIVIEGKDEINSLGNRINYLGYGFCNAYKEPRNTTLDLEKWPTDYLSGASMLVKADVFKHIGLFREEFFMYHDDLEFCLRARAAGYQLGIAEKSICEHKYTFSSTMNLIYFMERNRLVTLLSLESIWTIVLTLPMLIPFEAAMIVYMGLKGRLIDKVRSIGYIFTPTGVKLIRDIRKEVRGYRKVADKDIVRNFSGKIDFSEISNPILDKIANPILNIYWSIVKNLVR